MKRSEPLHRPRALTTDELRVVVTELLLARAPKTMQFGEIRNALLAEGHRFSTGTLETVLGEFRAPPPSPSATHHALEPELPPGLAVRLAVELHKLEVDAVQLGHAAHPQFRLRIDKVAYGSLPFWLSFWLARPDDFRAAPSGPLWMTLPSWRLPLTPLVDPMSQLPALGVLQFPDVRSATGMAQSIAEALLRDAAAGSSLEVEECDQAEANRRLGAGVMIHTRRSSRGGGRARFAESTCLKCGMPLSDPESVKIGVGPECRRHLGADVINALRSTSRARCDVLGARRATHWVEVVKSRFANLAT